MYCLEATGVRLSVNCCGSLVYTFSCLLLPCASLVYISLSTSAVMAAFMFVFVCEGVGVALFTFFALLLLQYASLVYIILCMYVLHNL